MRKHILLALQLFLGDVGTQLHATDEYQRAGEKQRDYRNSIVETVLSYRRGYVYLGIAALVSFCLDYFMLVWDSRISAI